MEKEIPLHHTLKPILDGYLDSSGLRARPDSPLLLAARGKTGELTGRAIDHLAAWTMFRRPLKNVLLPMIRSEQRVSRIFWKVEAGLEVAQRIAGHARGRIASVYDCCGQKVVLEEMERIRFRD